MRAREALGFGTVLGVGHPVPTLYLRLITGFGTLWDKLGQCPRDYSGFYLTALGQSRDSSRSQTVPPLCSRLWGFWGTGFPSRTVFPFGVVASALVYGVYGVLVPPRAGLLSLNSLLSHRHRFGAGAAAVLIFRGGCGRFRC